MKTDEGFLHRFGKAFVHSETFPAPIAAHPQFAVLPGNDFAVLFFPFPNLLHECLSPDVVAVFLFGFFQIPLHYVLGGNTRMIGSGQP